MQQPHMKALQQFRAQQQEQIERTDRAIKILGGGVAVVHKSRKRKLSAEARSRISAAQKARWAKRKPVASAA